jgi:type IV pilus assembly protein PilM
LFNFFPLFLGKKKEPVTLLDIGSHNIKAIGLDSNLRIEVADLISVPEAEPELEKLPKSKDFLIIEGLRRLFLKHKNLPANIFLILSDRTVFVRVLQIFPMSPKETEKAVNYEAKLQIPFPIKRIQVNYFILGTIFEKNTKKNEVLLLATPLDIVESHLEILEKSELHPRVIDLNCLSFWRFFLANYSHLIGKTVAIIDLGASKCEINIIRKGNLSFSRVIPIGGVDFTRAIGEEIGMDSAEALKKEYGSAHRIVWGIEEGKEQIVGRIYSCLSPIFSQFLNDLQRSLEFYLSQFPDSPVEQILITGGGSNMKEIGEFISENLNRVPVERFKLKEEFFSFSPSVDKESRDLLKNQGTLQFFTPLLGLLKRETSKVRINLTVSKDRKKGITQGLPDFFTEAVNKWLAISLAALLLLIFISAQVVLRLEKIYSSKLGSLKNMENSLNINQGNSSLREKLQVLVSGTEALRKIISQKDVPLNELVEAISRSIDERIFLNQMVFDYNSRQIEIDGCSKDSEAVNAFLEKLSQKNKFKKMSLLYIKENSENAGKFTKIFKVIGEF